MYVDGNTHAGEVTGGEAGLHLVHVLATKYGSDALVTEALDHFSYYVIPRVNPDGAETYLTGTTPKNPNPRDNDGDGRFDEDPPEDVNGDGIISYMRIRDPNGPLCTHPEDPRLMVARKGGEPGQWRMIGREGRDNDGDGQVNEDEPDPWARSPIATIRWGGGVPMSSCTARANILFPSPRPRSRWTSPWPTPTSTVSPPITRTAA